MTRCLSSIFTHFSGSFQYSFSPDSAFNKPFFSSDNILDFFTIHSQNSRISRRIPVRFEESKTTKYLLFCSSFSLSPYSCGNLLPFQHQFDLTVTCITRSITRATSTIPPASRISLFFISAPYLSFLKSADLTVPATDRSQAGSVHAES